MSFEELVAAVLALVGNTVRHLVGLGAGAGAVGFGLRIGWLAAESFRGPGRKEVDRG